MPEVPPFVSPGPPSDPRLEADSELHFRCGPELDCFTQCCRDVSIVLTPYDVLRMKRALRMDSSEFLDKYTLAINRGTARFPIVLRMDPETLQCPFLGSQGCSIYANRPWACRMYPLGVAEPRQPAAGQTGFYFLIREGLCHGHGKGSPCTVRSWLASQGLEEYEMMESSFKGLMLDEFWRDSEPLPPEKVEMYFMACYDLDRFRRFVFETSFFERFVIDDARIDAVREDDEELLELAFEWLRFLLFREKTLRLREPSAVGGRGQAASASGAATG
ncbi:MAG TPA: YkgJ family cysteine cluster protein [bacterium]|nr:YkgJ family cysteine cluster protein [bacterium]